MESFSEEGRIWRLGSLASRHGRNPEDHRLAIVLVQRIFVCIDTFDKLASEYRQELLESLQEIVLVPSNIQIFLTGRAYIHDEIGEFFSEAVRIPITIRYEAEGWHTTPKAMDSQLRADIMRVIPEKILENIK